MLSIKTKDEKIMAALLICGTVKEAAESAGVSLGTVYSRLKNEEFFTEYQNRKDAAINEATAQLVSTLALAVKTVNDILLDPKTASQIKLNAAQLILTNTLKYTEQVTLLRRVEKLEERQIQNEQGRTK